MDMHETIDTLFEALQQRDPHTLASLCAQDVQIEDPLLEGAPAPGDPVGLVEGLAALGPVAAWRLIDGASAAVGWYSGLAGNGKHASPQGVMLLDFEDGRIRRLRNYHDLCTATAPLRIQTASGSESRDQAKRGNQPERGRSKRAG
ncbi:MAG TPA: hypothetical protein ENJ79_07550 [Gammaproteobacteria bacterium]|nr:hypothetical protein [Gammaproteobacteria bacterium]